MKTSDFDYDLPPELIAQHPVSPRDASRLMVLHRDSGELEHLHFRDIVRYLQPHDVLVVNQTRVIPARLYASKLPGGGQVELLLLKKMDDLTWEVMVGGKGMKYGRQVQVDTDLLAEVIAVLDGPRRVLRFARPVEPSLIKIGHVPLPPYITAPLEDPEQYQTIFAQVPGSAAAPTAGLHFTSRLIHALKEMGVTWVTLTLHIGLDTFAPVTEADPLEHRIHTEWCQITAQAADTINDCRRRGGRIFAVGTTSVRTLETGARQAASGQVVAAYSGPTDLYILPGFQFRAVDAMITNFHLPKSTLIMLVSAFAGREQILHAYATAREKAYRFYSFGDAMLIL